VTDRDLTRRALAVTALGGLSLPVLAACGGGGGGSSTTAGTPSTDGGASSPASGGGNSTTADALVGTAQVPVGGGVILADQNVVVTQPEKGSFEGFSATCTHQGCLVTSIDDGFIICPCHGSHFAIDTGAPTSDSLATAPLGAVDITVSDGRITLG